MKQMCIVCMALLLWAGDCLAQITPRWKTLPEIPAMPKPDSSGFAAVNGILLYFAVFNKAAGNPVILLHGGFSSSGDWGFAVPLLVASHEVIVMDTRGHGRSTMDDRPFSYELFASDVKELMDILRISKASVVGWSDGGITGLVIAMKYPSHLNKLFTYGSNYNKSGEKNEPFDSALATKFMIRAKENYHTLSSTPDEFANLKLKIIKLYSSQPDLDTVALRSVRLPVVIGCGEYEQFYTRAHFESLAKLIPGAKLVILPAVSHGGPLQDPAGFHDAVIKFLDREK